MFTEDGILTAPEVLESETAVPPAGAAWLIVIVQVELAFDERLVALQDKPVTEGKPAIAVIVPPVPVRLNAVPLPSDPTTFEMFTATLPAAVALIVTATLARAPSPIARAFMPESKHV